MKANVSRRPVFVALLAALLALVFCAGAAAAIGIGPKIPPAIMAKLKKYDSRYYTVFSDLPADQAEAAVAHITSVAEEYYQMTKTLGNGKITSKLNVYIMTSREDYTAAGGQGYGSAYKDRLMANPVPQFAGEVWHIIQHEMFHQFMHSIVTETGPMWVDEGMAEYYGESLWTGDGMAPGIFPAFRLKRLQPRAAAGTLREFKEFMSVKVDGVTRWPIEDYDQCWTMIYYLLNAEGGKYQKGLNAYIKMTAAGAPFDAAFTKCFGKTSDAMQKDYVAWLTGLKESVGDLAYARATAATLTSFFGRAWCEKQTFATAEEFLKAARDGTLKKHPKQPLPDDLLQSALKRADALKTWSLDVPEKGLPRLVLKQDDGATLTASFKLKDGKVEEVKVDVKEAPAPQ